MVKYTEVQKWKSPLENFHMVSTLHTYLPIRNEHFSYAGKLGSQFISQLFWQHWCQNGPHGMLQYAIFYIWIVLVTAQIRGNRNKAFLVFLLVQRRTVNFAKWTNADNREVHYGHRVVEFLNRGYKIRKIFA